MKIGILTFHRACNYGAVLQCYALQQILKSMGHDVYVVDYRQQAIEQTYRIFITKYTIQKLMHPRGTFYFWRDVFRRKRRYDHFNKFRNKYLHLSNPCFTQHDTPLMDAYIVGSDQLWNLKHTKGIDEVYWGNFERPSDSKLFTYAVSGQVQTLSDIPIELQKQYLQKFNNLSIREKTMADYISGSLGLDTHIDVDPTLLTTKDLWEEMTDTRFQNKNYVLLYQVRGNRQILRSKAKLLADCLHCEVIEISDISHSPVEFVSLFRYARYVVTSSFHGTAFSLIFERPLFSVMLHDGGDERYESLLRKIGAASMLVEKDFNPQPESFDYSLIKEKLEKLRSDSLNYMKNVIYHC